LPILEPLIVSLRFSAAGTTEADNPTVMTASHMYNDEDGKHFDHVSYRQHTWLAGPYHVI
jgi:hypothetical protein